VRGNAAEIRQVVMNLATNASEAIGDRDGVIRVVTERVTISSDSNLAGTKNLPEGDYMRGFRQRVKGMEPRVSLTKSGPLKMAALVRRSS
jgi:hypothetical protein